MNCPYCHFPLSDYAGNAKACNYCHHDPIFFYRFGEESYYAIEFSFHNDKDDNYYIVHHNIRTREVMLYGNDDKDGLPRKIMNFPIDTINSPRHAEELYLKFLHLKAFL